MNLRGLQLFRNIVLRGSLSDAADRLNLSVSAASRLLGQLESQLSLTLFSRTRRALELTEEGALFYQQITNTLDGIDEISLIAHDVRSRARNWLSVVTAAPLAGGLVVPAIARLHKTGPEFQCTLHIETRFAIERKVAARGYNLGMISLPVENEIIPLDIMPILRTRLCVLMRENHPFAAMNEITVEELGRQQLVSLASGQRWRMRLDEIMGQAGLRPKIAFETGSTVATVEMVRHGLGLTLIDPITFPQAAQTGLVMRPLAGEHWITYASIHAKGPHAALSERFLDALSAELEDRRSADPQMADLLYLI